MFVVRSVKLKGVINLEMEFNFREISNRDGFAGLHRAVALAVVDSTGKMLCSTG